METKAKTSTGLVLRILHILAWVIFIGICIEAGAIIFNTIFTLVLDPVDAQRLWKEIDLSNLYIYDPGNFFVVNLFISIVVVSKAVMFYLIVRILHNKKLNMSRPFNEEVRRFIFTISYITFLIGLFSLWGVKYTEWLVGQGVQMPDIHYLRLDGGDVWLFMSVILFVIAQIFKRGIEIQSENELTV